MASLTVSQPIIECKNDASNKSPTVAPSPFDNLNSNADIIIRSKVSLVDFYVVKSILAFASPFFTTMFSLSQTGVSQEVKDGKPVILVDEDEETLELLFKYCYPLWTSSLGEPSLEGLIKAHNAAEKYQMQGVEDYIQMEFVAERFLKEQPLRMYAITLHYQFILEARLAAKATLRLPVLGRQYFDELEHITAGAYHRLQVYHLKCAEVAQNVAKNLEWVTDNHVAWFECTNEGQYSQSVVISGNRGQWVRGRWWWDYMTQAASSLAEKPSGTTVMDPDIMDEALGKASGCAFCRGRAFKELRAFARVFAAEVDRATAQIVLEVLEVKS